MGLVELCGLAENSTLLKSPLTETECVLYQYLIEEYRSSGKSGHWAKIAEGNSFYVPFWLDDGTGKIMVLPQGAELILPVDFECRSTITGSLPDSVIKFMEKSGISYRAWLGRRTLRFKEWYIRPQEQVYVLGSARKTGGDGLGNKHELMRRIEELKKNPQEMDKLDTNRDGQLSIEEWDSAVAKIEDELLQETLKNASWENPFDIVITKAEAETVFIISDCSEKDLLSKFGWEVFWGVFGGAALSLALLAYLLWRLNIVRF